MARTAVTQRRLLKLDGVDDVLKNIDGIDRRMGENLKSLYIRAAMVIADEARKNIDGIPSVLVSGQAKDILKDQVITAKGEPRKPNVIVGVSQIKGRKQAEARGIRYANPYWFEFGTAERYTRKGAARGQMVPTPFFRPAVTAKRSEVANTLATGLKMIIGTDKEGGPSK